VEVNIDELSQDTLWKLYSFVNDGATEGLIDAPNANAREKGNATDQVQARHTLPQHEQTSNEVCGIMDDECRVRGLGDTMPEAG